MNDSITVSLDKVASTCGNCYAPLNRTLANILDVLKHWPIECVECHTLLRWVYYDGGEKPKFKAIVCRHCGETFYRDRYATEYCSPGCANRARAARRRAEKAAVK